MGCCECYHLWKKNITLFVVLTIPVLQGHDPHQAWKKKLGHRPRPWRHAIRASKSKSSIIGRRGLLRMAISLAPELPGLGRVDIHALENGSVEMRRDCLAKWEMWHLQQGMMSVRWRKSLQSVGFLALHVEKARWRIASGHIWLSLITACARFIPVKFRTAAGGYRLVQSSVILRDSKGGMYTQ